MPNSELLASLMVVPDVPVIGSPAGVGADWGYRSAHRVVLLLGAAYANTSTSRPLPDWSGFTLALWLGVGVLVICGICAGLVAGRVAPVGCLLRCVRLRALLSRRRDVQADQVAARSPAASFAVHRCSQAACARPPGDPRRRGRRARRDVCDSEILIVPSDAGESAIRASAAPCRTAIVTFARTASTASCRSTGCLGALAAGVSAICALDVAEATGPLPTAASSGWAWACGRGRSAARGARPAWRSALEPGVLAAVVDAGFSRSSWSGAR